MFVFLMLSQRSLWLCSFFFFLFSIFCFVAVRATILSSRPMTSSSACYSAIDSFYCIFHLCLFFSYTWALVDISYAFILFPRSWIIFTVIILNYFSGRFPISNSFSCFSGVLCCPFICRQDVFISFFILISFL